MLLYVVQIELVFASLVRTLEQSRVLDSSGEYQVVPGIAVATKQPLPRGLVSATPDISLVTQCSFNHLHHLVILSQRWQVLHIFHFPVTYDHVWNKRIVLKKKTEE